MTNKNKHDNDPVMQKLRVADGVIAVFGLIVAILRLRRSHQLKKGD